MNTLYTPWGTPDSVGSLTDDMGIIVVSTPSHGGIGIDEAHQRVLEAIGIKPSRYGNRTLQWWEEDVDWAVPYLVFEDEMTEWGPVKIHGAEKMREYAVRGLRGYRDDWLEEVEAYRSAKGQSLQAEELSKNQIGGSHANN